MEVGVVMVCVVVMGCVGMFLRHAVQAVGVYCGLKYR